MADRIIMIFKKKRGLHHKKTAAIFLLFLYSLQNKSLNRRMNDLIQSAAHLLITEYYIRYRLTVNGIIIFYNIFSK